MKPFLLTMLNGITLAALYFIVASGFTIIFGMMRVVNMAHGSIYLLGAYIGYSVAAASESWLLGIAGAALGSAVAGVIMHRVFLDRYQGQDLRQALITIGLSIVIADLLLAGYGGLTYQLDIPDVLFGGVRLPLVGGYSLFRLVLIGFAIMVYIVLWLLIQRTRFGMIIRAAVDDRHMLAATGVNVPLVSTAVFALAAGLVGMAGVIGGSALSIAPGDDVHYLLSSLVVVIVGGMGNLKGAAVGALLIGLAEQIGLAYLPTYSAVISFVIMVAVLAYRPYGLFGRPA
ncbi:branched-chain amino acid ABC transporter permease [Pusillimonas sp. ANT_WB101]|uniref:branched-chain amino acid ABC transporter permease n=1 Tax=Pusillimonas sp. ANT_WB101 TaxID=2597356 RepID=UPI0011EFC289|nr:branched-chain amino acid ABC transporter permease [Pusillimonas sp. ANT_WB101]KAA0892900.1 branched-chain amino acid ABC transporter permease [Pusillimonas sp. ANT_WB101]NYT77623.1 branched-chain amino acid ABC transporter permease [Alcaligenaceae bacterium]